MANVCIKQGQGGWKIVMESGKLMPKLYKTNAACQKRIDELDRHKK